MICYVMMCYLIYAIGVLTYAMLGSLTHVMSCYVMLSALYNNMCYVMTCYIAAICYVNRVLGYDISYVNMLHVYSCRREHHYEDMKTTRKT